MGCKSVGFFVEDSAPRSDLNKVGEVSLQTSMSNGAMNAALDWSCFACLPNGHIALFNYLFFDVGRADERASSISPRSALFTASSFGKAFATCGSSTITFVAERIRLAYLPRTKTPKSDRLYSGRDQSLSSDLAFFIDFSLF